MKTALPLVILTMLIGEWGIPQTEQFARDMRSKSHFWWLLTLSEKMGFGQKMAMSLFI
ncbi:lipopolysaccharide ABC transporter permease, partial [Pasteurella multocida subsp. multocida str. Anand1_cattle]